MAEISTNSGKINVSAGQNTANVGITKDYSQYYSQLSKDWATKTNGLVNNEDYSSKYYAEKSKDWATNSENNLNSVISQHEQITSEITQAREDISTDLSGALLDIESNKTNSITEINTARDNGVNTVNSALENFDNTVETAQTDITNLKNSSVEEIKAEGEEQVATIKQTGADELSKITQSGIDAVKADVTDLKTQVAAKANMTDVWTLSTVGNASIPMSWGASGSKYIAPANGRFLLEVSLGNANEYIRLYSTKNGINRIATGNVAFVAVVDISVDKDDEVILFHNISKEPTAFKFVQANGD